MNSSEDYWTGRNTTFEDIIGEGKLYKRKNNNRKIILCEGARGSSDIELLKKITKGEYEIFPCGTRRNVLEALDKLIKNGSEYGDFKKLYAVVDRDEVIDWEKFNLKYDNKLLTWSVNYRDLETFLLRSWSWKSIYRVLKLPLIESKIYPRRDFKTKSDDLNIKFRNDEIAVCNAWKFHLRSKGRVYPDCLQIIEGEYQNYDDIYQQIREENNIHEKVILPENIEDLTNAICNKKVVIDEKKYEDYQERAKHVHGKRLISLVAARVFSETYNERKRTGITEKELEKLKRKLQIKSNERFSSLADRIVHDISEKEMREILPELT